MAMVTPEPRPGIDSAWSIGLLLALAFVAQQMVRSISVPDVVGWMAAGLILGQGGMRVVLPAASGSVDLVYAVAALWLGCLVGLGLDLRWERRRPPLPLAIFLSTAGTAAVFGGGAILLAGLSVESALALGALATFWGPIVVSTLTRKNEPVLAAALGAGFSLTLLSAVLLVAAQRDSFASGAGPVLLRLWTSAALGPALALLLWRLRLLGTPTASVVGLGAGFLLLALLVRDAYLFALIAGLGAGVVLAAMDGSGRLRQMLEPGRSPAGLVFFALAGASLDPVQLVTSPAPGLYELLVLQLLVVVAARVLAPSAWHPLPLAPDVFSRRHGLLLLPAGALLYEIACRPEGVAALFAPPLSQLVRQIAVADLLLYAVLLPALARLFMPPEDLVFFEPEKPAELPLGAAAESTESAAR
jgi:hypothetical protein